MNSRCTEMAALGRPLYLGMLYDCRSDSFIPGVTLWDKKVLYDDLDVHQQHKSHLEFAASDTLSDKANLLNISASHKASFLAGLVDIGGSAKYLHDRKSSAHQCRVTMRYSQTTIFKQLTMTELAHITYPQVFDQQTATHVVTAVLYGAHTFMVFDHIAGENENKQDIVGNLHAVIKKICTISIDGEASVKMTEYEKNLAENINVTFYGDYIPEQNPTTYKDALEMYKKLPTLLKEENSNGVPLTVWLYPLTLLNDKAAKLMREISSSLMSEMECVLEELGEVERRCNDLIKKQLMEDFPDLKDRLIKFQELSNNYKMALQNALVSVLPAIRSGAKEDKAVSDILTTHYSSPFTASSMNQWLDDMLTELNILSLYTNMLKDLTVVRSLGSLNFVLFNPDIDVVVCLSFTSLKNKDAYLVAVKDFLNSEIFTMEQTNKKATSFQATQPWFTSPDIAMRMRQNLSLFTSFLKANKNEKRIKFIIASISDPSNPGNSIRLYQNGFLKDPKFAPVSKPPLPVVVTSDENVILKLSKSSSGETVRFRVEYRRTPQTDSAADVDKWTVSDTSDAQTRFPLTGLKPAEQYLVRYRAVGDVGVSEASDSVSFSFNWKRDVKVKLNAWDLLTYLRTKIMTSMGMSRWSLSTMMSEVSNVVSSPTLPYIDTIPGGLRTGMALYFQGVGFAPGQGERFSFNLVTGLTADDDIAFHFNPRINETVVQNSRRNGWWENEERTSECPISSGSAFDIFIVTKAEGYVVYVNGQWNCLFKHRIPMEKVAKLYICGDVIMNVVGIVGNWNTSTFGKELKSGVSRTKMSDIQSDIPQPVCNPRKQYLGSIPGGLRPGMALFFQGVVPSDCERFEINLQTGQRHLHDIAFHFNPRMSSVVRNSCRNGGWDKEHLETPGGPFVKGGAFDIIMVIKQECYEVIVNGLVCCKFDHRIPVAKVTTLDIRGDVFMNILRIIEVDDVNPKVITPVNI